MMESQTTELDSSSSQLTAVVSVALWVTGVLVHRGRQTACSATDPLKMNLS